MTPRRSIGLAVLCCALVLPTASAAQGEPLATGREVRLFVRGVAGTFEGVLTGIRPDALTLVLRDGSFFTLQTQQVERSQVLGMRRNTKRGALVGLGVGVVAGVALAVSSETGCLENSGFCDHFEEWELILPPVVGAGLGVTVGWYVQTPRWVPGFMPASAPGDGGFALRWSLPAGSRHRASSR